MNTPQNIIEAYLAVYREGVSEHPDVAGQPDFARRADEILKRRKAARTPEAKAAKKAAAFFDNSVITKKDKKNKVMDAREIPPKVNLIKTRLRLMGLNMSYEPEGEVIKEVNTPDDNGFTKCWPGKKKVGFKMKGGKKVNNCVPKEEFVIEKEMTDKEVKAENKLKSKYDDSGMKASMIQQYGPEKGKQVYFATIRKKAMEEAFMDPEEELPGSRRKPIENVASHPNPKVRKKAVRGMVKQMEKEYGGKWKSSSKDPAVEEQLDYIEEARRSRTERRASNAGKKGYDAKGNPIPRVSTIHVIDDIDDNRGDQRHPDAARIDVMRSTNRVWKKVKSLTPGEFAHHKLRKSGEPVTEETNKDPGDRYGFDEFRSSKKFKDTTKPIKSVGRLGDSPRRPAKRSVVTARGGSAFGSNKPSTPMDDPGSFAKDLRDRIGIRGLKRKDVHFTGGMSKGSNKGLSGPEKKGKLVSKIVDPSDKEIITTDDHLGNTRAMAFAASKAAPNAKVKAYQSRPATRKPKGKGKVGDIVPSRVGKENKPEDINIGIRANSDAPKTTKQTQKARKKARRNMGEEMTWYKEDFELIYDYILEQLILEGLAEDYDSAAELTEEFDDELLEDLMREAITAIGAPAPEPKRPEKKGPRKFASPYGKGKKIAPKKEYKEDFTPYEFWMNIIETQQPEIVEEDEEEIVEIVEEGPTTSYDYWKKYIEENANFSNN
jgi:hypothetical protein